MEWFPAGTTWNVVDVVMKGDGYIFVHFEQVETQTNLHYGKTYERRSEGGRHLS